MKGVLPWLVCWAFRDYKRFCSALASLVGSVLQYFIAFVPIAQQSGQAALLGRLSPSMCLWFCQCLQIQKNYVLQASSVLGVSLSFVSYPGGELFCSCLCKYSAVDRNNDVMAF
jgi:hypothetical protein